MDPVQMRKKVSAGLLMYRIRDGRLEVFIGHPGGPFSRFRDDDTWSIPKGEVGKDEGLLEAAIREFKEEVGIEPQGPYQELGLIRQKSGKLVHAWAFCGDWSESNILRSNTFSLEWPPGSGQRQSYPEVDRVAFLSLAEARKKLKAAQHPLLDRLEALLADELKTPQTAL